MTTMQFNLNAVKIDGYNKGQLVEANVRFAYGKDTKADNVPHTISGDIEIDGIQYQIKSARATLVEGNDIEKYLSEDAADRYLYVTKTGLAYDMDKSEWSLFVHKFASVQTNEDGNVKVRLKTESSAMIAWLQEYNRYGSAW